MAQQTQPTAERARVLVVEDTPQIAELVSTALRYEGYEVATSGDGEDALEQIASWAPDLVVLDVMLPKLDGFEVQRRLADREDAPPILLLTARDHTVDKVRGLDLGADDYVTKPFSVEELLARVRRILRRHSSPASGGSAPEATGARHSFEDLSLDEDTREVHRGDQLVELTPREFDLLRYLLQNAGIVLTKAQILDAVWEYDFGGDANIVETYVSYLRRKVDIVDPRLIHTVRGVGYTIRLPRRT